MESVTRKEKLNAHMKNIEKIISDDNLSAEQKVYLVTSQMSCLNVLVNYMIEPFRKQVKNSELVRYAEATFIPFLKDINVNEWE